MHAGTRTYTCTIHAQSPLAIQRAKPQYCDEMILPSIFSLFFLFFAKGALCIVKTIEHAYTYIYNLIIYNQNINILFADYWVYIHILIYWIIYFILFYRFMILYICYSLFTYTPRNTLYCNIRHTWDLFIDRSDLNCIKLHLQAYLLGWEITRRSTFLFSFFCFVFP